MPSLCGLFGYGQLRLHKNTASVATSANNGFNDVASTLATTILQAESELLRLPVSRNERPFDVDIWVKGGDLKNGGLPSTKLKRVPSTQHKHTAQTQTHRHKHKRKHKHTDTNTELTHTHTYTFWRLSSDGSTSSGNPPHPVLLVLGQGPAQLDVNLPTPPQPKGTFEHSMIDLPPTFQVSHPISSFNTCTLNPRFLVLCSFQL